MSQITATRVGIGLWYREGAGCSSQSVCGQTFLHIQTRASNSVVAADEAIFRARPLRTFQPKIFQLTSHSVCVQMTIYALYLLDELLMKFHYSLKEVP
jgi:hypothetical protein